MSKKKSRATKKKDDEDESNDRLFALLLMILAGPAVIATSVVTRYYLGVLLGVFLEAWGIRDTPEIHPYLKLVIKWKTKKQQVEVKQSPDAKVLTAGRDVNVYNVIPGSQTVQDPNQPKIVTGLTVGFEAWGNQTGRSLLYLQASNVGHISVFIPSPLSLQIRLPDGKFLIPKSDEWETNREFPFELGPGRALSIWREVHGFAASMKKMGYSGTVKLSVVCTDEAGRAFEGGQVLFDIEDYAKSAGV